MSVFRDAPTLNRPRPVRRRPLWRFAAVLAALFAPVAAETHSGDSARVLFVSSQTSAPYLEFVEETKRVFGDDTGIALSTSEVTASQLLDDSIPVGLKQYDMVVALGTQAAQSLHYRMPDAPVVYALIPQTAFTSLRQSGRLACPNQRCTAVYIDQPLHRMIDILGIAFSDRHNPGVLLGPTSVHNGPELSALAKRHGLTLEVAEVTAQDELLPTLRTLLKRTDVLLSLPDPLVYNRQTAKSVLLTTYRYRVPVMAYSRAYVDAGAALSVYSTPRQAARQTAAIVRNYLAGDRHQLPEPQYPKYFKLSVNRHVAESLDLHLDDKPELRALMHDTDHEKTEHTQ